MITLAILACLHGDPSVCKEDGYRYDTESIKSCEAFSMMALAQWVAEHPGWQIKKWTCTTSALADRRRPL